MLFEIYFFKKARLSSVFEKRAYSSKTEYISKNTFVIAKIFMVSQCSIGLGINKISEQNLIISLSGNSKKNENLKNEHNFSRKCYAFKVFCCFYYNIAQYHGRQFIGIHGVHLRKLTLVSTFAKMYFFDLICIHRDISYCKEQNR